MKSNPRISVIVPVYNVENYLSQCVNSVMDQTFRDIELLLIDDGSCDGSGDLCDELAGQDVRIRVFHKKNGGVSATRNLGLDNAKGEWVCFIDSDDYISPIYLESALAYSSFDLVSVSLQEFGAANSINGVSKECTYMMSRDAFSLLDFSPNDKAKTPYLSSCVHLFRKQIIDDNQIRFNSSLRYGEDTMFVVTYLQYCKEIVQLPKVYYYYRIVDNAFQRKYRLSGEETNLHCAALMETFDKYCDAFQCSMPQLFYSNYVTYLRAYMNYLSKENVYDNFKHSLNCLNISYEHLRFAGRKLPLMIFLMRVFPKVAYLLKRRVL